ncbi:MAG: phosphoribosylanthranilate isomerase [Caldilineales bacterium]|nr:phosphoribosylanthranilate isomerase [Caldilineales bacterium]
MTTVKICGITNLADAEIALDAGADMLGFICYRKSPRYVTPAQIAAILQGLHRPVISVGVFVNEPIESLRIIIDSAGLSLVQLHGDEPLAIVQELAGKAFKAVRPTRLEETKQAKIYYTKIQSTSGPDLLIDAYDPKAYGGTGQRADWGIAAALARECRLLLAGGLTPDNVADAVRQVRPWGVDVSSGVEMSPGRKDPVAVHAFVRAAKEVADG